MKIEYRHIYFNELPNHEFYCLNKRTRAVLGVVKWYPIWKQYCFFPECDIVFSQDCLADIQHFIGQLKENRLTTGIRNGLLFMLLFCLFIFWLWKGGF